MNLWEILFPKKRGTQEAEFRRGNFEPRPQNIWRLGEMPEEPMTEWERQQIANFEAHLKWLREHPEFERGIQVGP
jgi:hypothetical protein